MPNTESIMLIFFLFSVKARLFAADYLRSALESFRDSVLRQKPFQTAQPD